MKRPVALITGASAGLGEALAYELTGRGYELVLTARRLEKLKTVCEKVDTLGGKADAVAMDVTDYDRTAKMVVELDEKYGGFDLVIANAGIGTSPARLLMPTK